MISGIDLTNLATVAATTTIVAKAITRQVAAHCRLATDLDSSVHRPEGPLDSVEEVQQKPRRRMVMVCG